MISSVEALLAELEQEKATTRRMLERVPNEKLSWKPHPKSMTLGQLALHVASTPGAVARLAASEGMDTANVSFDPPSPQNAAELLTALEAGVMAAKDFLSSLDEPKAMAPWKLTSHGREIFTIPRLAVVRSIMLNHWYHHRGELVVYLRLLDIPVPSVYGPSADENPFA